MKQNHLFTDLGSQSRWSIQLTPHPFFFFVPSQFVDSLSEPSPAALMPPLPADARNSFFISSFENAHALTHVQRKFTIGLPWSGRFQYSKAVDGVLGCPFLQLSGQRQASSVRKFFQLSVILVTAFRRTFKVIITVIACFFIQSVSPSVDRGLGYQASPDFEKVASASRL